MVYLYLPATDYRPEAVRVIQDTDGLFVAQYYAVSMNLWLTRTGWKILEQAIAYAMTLHPMPQKALNEMVVGCIEHMETPGQVEWKAYTENYEGGTDEYRFSQRMTQEAFHSLVRLLSEEGKSTQLELMAHQSDRYCVFNVYNGNNINLRGKFVPDAEYLGIPIATPDCCSDLEQKIIEELEENFRSIDDNEEDEVLMIHMANVKATPQ